MDVKYRTLILWILILMMLTGCQSNEVTSTDPNVIDAGRPAFLAIDHGLVYLKDFESKVDYFDFESGKSVEILPSTFCDGRPFDGENCQGNIERILPSGLFTDASDRIYAFTEYLSEDGGRNTELLRMNKDGQKLQFQSTDLKDYIQAAVQLNGKLYVIENQGSSEKTIVKCLSMKGKLLEDIEFPGQVLELIPDGQRLYFRQGELDVTNKPLYYYDTEEKSFGETGIVAAGYLRISGERFLSVIRNEEVDFTEKEAFSIVFFEKGKEQIILENNAGNVFFLDDEIVTSHTGLEALEPELQRSVNRYDVEGNKKGEVLLEEGHEVVGVVQNKIICTDQEDNLVYYTLEGL